MIEYAYIEAEEAAYPIPCHFTVFKINFRKATEEAIKKAKEDNWESGITITTTRELREEIKKQSSLVLMCILEEEVKRSELAQKILKMRAVAKFTGRNPNHNNHVFHDIIFSKE